ncbi:Polygalacturonase [Glycine max]|nr:Polygalacturonase [Glycine max]
MKMVFPHSMVTIALVLMLASYVKAHVGLFDIRKYGAIPNGDTTMDLQNAWRDACVSMTPSKVVVPSGVEEKSSEYQEPRDLRSNPFQGGGNDAILPRKGIG